MKHNNNNNNDKLIIHHTQAKNSRALFFQPTRKKTIAQRAVWFSVFQERSNETVRSDRKLLRENSLPEEIYKKRKI
jgi:hypothetical protein